MKLKNLVEVQKNDDLKLSHKNLTQLPQDLPNHIIGSFYCDNNKLTSLKFCPREIDGWIFLDRNNLTSLEYGPLIVGRGFSCNHNELTSLKFCPSKVGGTFNCSYNRLTSLEFCPSAIGGAFNCSVNRLTSLEHCPSEVGKLFYCGRNELTSLKDVHKQIKKIGGDFCCYKNPIRSHILGLMLISIGGTILTGLGDDKVVDDILNKWKNQGRRGVLGCQRDLIAAGYKELAQL